MQRAAQPLSGWSSDAVWIDCSLCLKVSVAYRAYLEIGGGFYFECFMYTEHLGVINLSWEQVDTGK